MLLIDLYEHKTNKQIEKILHRNSDAIGMKARQIGLKKGKFTVYDKDVFLDTLKSYATELGRTLAFYEIMDFEWCPSLNSVIRYFGGYTKACELIGLDINKCIFNNRITVYKSKNNDICYSKSEAFITDFFIDNNINYKKEVKYRDYIDDERCAKKICDWVIGDNVFVEFFGLMNKDYYRKKTENKILICQENNIVLIEVYEKDLKNLKEVFKNFIPN